ncbi:MAG: hypothetical protein OXJ55_03985 [Caldilineaceae bacterium]|nr:hypothetical protein [Caldilineaceae bacterium]
MGMKIDRFTLGIVLGVILLVIGAVITVVFAGDRGWQSAEYLNEDTPEAVVHDAFLAVLRNEPDVAMSHYSRDVLEDEDNERFRDRFNYYDSGRSARRMRIVDVDINDEGDKAYVTVAIDNFHQGGLFDSGTSTHRRTIPLVREDDAWKIDTDDLFY